MKIDCISRQSDLFLNRFFFLRLHDSMVIFNTANSSTVLFLRISYCGHGRGGLAFYHVLYCPLQFVCLLFKIRPRDGYMSTEIVWNISYAPCIDVSQLSWENLVSDSFAIFCMFCNCVDHVKLYIMAVKSTLSINISIVQKCLECISEVLG